VLRLMQTKLVKKLLVGMPGLSAMCCSRPESNTHSHETANTARSRIEVCIVSIDIEDGAKNSKIQRGCLRIGREDEAFED